MSARDRMGCEGFSLVELLVAMVVGLQIAVAIYGLLALGQRAFHNEPAYAERQENSRAAMAAIKHDLAAAGEALPPWQQVFTAGLSGAGPIDHEGAPTDVLEMLTNPRHHDLEAACDVAVAGPWVVLKGQSSRIDVGDVVAVVMVDQTSALRIVTAVEHGVLPQTGDCQAGVRTTVRADPGDAEGLNGPSVCDGAATCAPVGVVSMDRVSYRIGMVGTTPVLQRRSASRGANFEIVAEGVERLTVRYQALAAGPGWGADPPVAISGDVGSLVTGVEVLLSTRTLAENVLGATVAAAGPRAVRGQARVSVAVDAALIHLISLGPTPQQPLWE